MMCHYIGNTPVIKIDIFVFIFGKRVSVMLETFSVSKGSLEILKISLSISFNLVLKISQKKLIKKVL